MKSILTFIATLIWVSFVNASTQVGNGGVVLVCSPQSGRPEVQILDFVEAEILWRFEIQKSSLVDPFMIVELRLNDLGRLDPLRANRLRERLRSFKSESFFIENAMLVRTEDEQNIAIPKECIIDQAVVQINPIFPQERRYNISEMYWSSLSDRPVEQAGLIFHELIYREAIEVGQTTSRRVRYYTALVFSTQLSRLDDREYQDILSRVGLPLLPKLPLVPELRDNATKEDAIEAANDIAIGFDSISPAVEWTKLTDQVRGGSSTIELKIQPDGKARISGTLALIDGAGFASVRATRIDKTLWNFAKSKRIVIRARGDGRTYRVLLKDTAAVRSQIDYSWEADIKPGPQYEDIPLEFSSFSSIRRGRPYATNSTLNLEEIVEIGLQINDKKEGPFMIDLDSVRLEKMP